MKAMSKTAVRRELQRCIRDAVHAIGGSGGRRECRYCLCPSYAGERAHFRNDGKEADEPCEVEVMKAALRYLR